MSAMFFKKTNVEAEYKGKLNIGGCPPALIPRGGAERRAAAIVSQLPPPGVNNLPLFSETLRVQNCPCIKMLKSLFVRRGHSYGPEVSIDV